MSNLALPADSLMPAAEEPVGFKKGKETHHGHTHADKVLYVVHDHQWRPVAFLDIHKHTSPRLGLPHPKQMVPHLSRNVHRGFLFVPRVVQNRLSCFQCRSLCCSVDRGMRINIQQAGCTRRLTAVRDPER